MNLQGRILEYGLDGEDVAVLQGELRRLGYEVPAAEVEGMTFGEGTHQAVLRLQPTAAVEPTGVVDAATIDALTRTETQRPPDWSLQYKLVGRPLEDWTQALLTGFTVHAADLEAGGSPLKPGVDITEAQDLFVVHLCTANRVDGGSPPRLHRTIGRQSV